MSELDEATAARLVQVAEERDLALLHVRVGRGELVVARVPPSELAAAGLPGPAVYREVHDGSTEVRQRPEPSPVEASGSERAAAPTAAPDPAGATVDAPMVGVFYRAPAPGQPPFVEVGSTVSPETTVGLIEAMKVFTAVPATCAGVVAEVLVESGAFVEFGQPLLRLRPGSDGAAGSGGS